MLTNLEFCGTKSLQNSVEACNRAICGELLQRAAREGWEAGRYFASRQRALLRKQALEQALAVGLATGRNRFELCPLTHPHALEEAQRSCRGGKTLLAVHCRFVSGASLAGEGTHEEAALSHRLEIGPAPTRRRQSLHGAAMVLRVHRHAEPAGPLLGYSITGDLTTWQVGDPGPLMERRFPAFFTSVGETVELHFPCSGPIFSDFPLNELEKRWLREVTDWDGQSDTYRQAFELLSPDAYAHRKLATELLSGALEQGRPLRREVEGGLVFFSFPSPLLSVQLAYFLDGKPVEGREITRCLRGAGRNPILLPVVDLISHAELQEPLELGSAFVFSSEGSLSVDVEATLTLEPEARLLLESELAGQDDPHEWIVAASAWPGIFSEGSLRDWPLSEPLRAAIQRRDVILVALLNRYTFHERLDRALFAEGWLRQRLEDRDSWQKERVECWHSDPTRPKHSFSLFPVRAYAEILFKGRPIEGVIDSRLALLRSGLAGTGP